MTLEPTEDDYRDAEPDWDGIDTDDAYGLARLEKIAVELQGRETEALRVYRPSSIQDQYHACTTKECVFVAGNQVGKSIAGYMEDGRAVCDCDPYNKYPKENGIGAIVVYKESQIKLNVYRYLLKPGAIDIIRDQETGLWRPYHPWCLPMSLASMSADQLHPSFLTA